MIVHKVLLSALLLSAVGLVAIFPKSGSAQESLERRRYTYKCVEKTQDIHVNVFTVGNSPFILEVLFPSLNKSFRHTARDYHRKYRDTLLTLVTPQFEFSTLDVPVKVINHVVYVKTRLVWDDQRVNIWCQYLGWD